MAHPSFYQHKCTYLPCFIHDMCPFEFFLCIFSFLYNDYLHNNNANLVCLWLHLPATVPRPLGRGYSLQNKLMNSLSDWLTKNLISYSHNYAMSSVFALDITSVDAAEENYTCLMNTATIMTTQINICLKWTFDDTKRIVVIINNLVN